ncbi:MAG: Homoserine kinase [Chloroflexi bacterium]|nr:MAG: Homoserine kinase [Chloroflexota bacterium]MBA4376255.1 homoserine kinase [Anaerolinea sp.]
MRFRVRVPATTANLGPGFDCLGLALDLWNELEVETTGNHLQILVEGEGQSVLPTNKTNAIVKAMEIYAHQHCKTLPAGIQIRCKNNIPLGSGLGSSSAAVVAGILAAAALLKIPENKQDLLECATQIEGHPDNVAPCLLGGLISSFVDNNKVISRRIPIAPLILLIVTPNFSFPTSQARAALPVEVPHKDAVFNLSRVVLLTEALRNGDVDLLSLAMLDQIHQPYRIPLIPGATAAIIAGRKAGAAAVVLSGAGPSLLAVLRNQSELQDVAAVMVDAFERAGLTARVFNPPFSNKGASVIEV